MTHVSYIILLLVAVTTHISQSQASEPTAHDDAIATFTQISAWRCKRIKRRFSESDLSDLLVISKKSHTAAYARRHQVKEFGLVLQRPQLLQQQPRSLGSLYASSVLEAEEKASKEKEESLQSFITSSAKETMYSRCYTEAAKNLRGFLANPTRNTKAKSKYGLGNQQVHYSLPKPKPSARSNRTSHFIRSTKPTNYEIATSKLLDHLAGLGHLARIATPHTASRSVPQKNPIYTTETLQPHIFATPEAPTTAIFCSKKASSISDQQISYTSLNNLTWHDKDNNKIEDKKRIETIQAHLTSYCTQQRCIYFIPTTDDLLRPVIISNNYVTGLVQARNTNTWKRQSARISAFIGICGMATSLWGTHLLASMVRQHTLVNRYIGAVSNNPECLFAGSALLFLGSLWKTFGYAHRHKMLTATLSPWDLTSAYAATAEDGSSLEVVALSLDAYLPKSTMLPSMSEQEWNTAYHERQDWYRCAQIVNLPQKKLN